MSSRVGFFLAAGLLLVAAALRLWQLSTLPPGLHRQEINDLWIVEQMRRGDIRLFYDLSGEGREGLYHAGLAASGGVFGSGLLGYHILSAWVNLLSLALLYALAARLFNPLAGIAALVFLTLNLYFNLLGREVAREMLLPALTTGVLLSLARAFAVYKRFHPRLAATTPFAVLGLLLGLGFYIHPSHFLIALAAMIFIAYMLLARQPLSQRTLGYLGFSILVMVIVGMPYLIASIRQPELAGAGRLLESYSPDRRPVLASIGAGLSGIFFVGDANPTRNLPGRPLVDLVSGLVILVGLLAAARNARQPRYTLILVTTVVLLPLPLFNNNSPNFLTYSALLPLLALFFGMGVVTLYHSFHVKARWVVGIGLSALLVFNLAWLTRDLFQVWPNLSEVYDTYTARVGQLAHYLDVTSDEIPTLVCDTVPITQAEVRLLSDTDLLLLMMNRKNAPLRFADCGSGLVIMSGGDAQQVAMPSATTFDNVHPYVRGWLAQGQVLSGSNIPPKAVVKLEVRQALADTIGKYTTTKPAAFAPEAIGGSGLAVPPIRFGGNVTFLGYETETNNAYLPNGVMTSITYWRVDGVMPPDLRLFTHILSDPAAIAAQNDTISVNAASLRERDVFIQITFVPLPSNIPDGQYDISIGVYQASDNSRMDVFADGQPRGKRLFLGQIRVARSGG